MAATQGWDNDFPKEPAEHGQCPASDTGIVKTLGESNTYVCETDHTGTYGRIRTAWRRAIRRPCLTSVTGVSSVLMPRSGDT